MAFKLPWKKKLPPSPPTEAPDVQPTEASDVRSTEVFGTKPMIIPGAKPPKVEKQASESRFSRVKRFRHEYKYMIDAKQEAILKIRTMGVMQLDSHVRANGS